MGTEVSQQGSSAPPPLPPNFRTYGELWAQLTQSCGLDLTHGLEAEHPCAKQLSYELQFYRQLQFCLAHMLSLR